MLSRKIITLSVWSMISFNLLLAFGAVWSFQRMTPEIRGVYERNVVSLEAGENMALALSGEKPDTAALKKALIAAESNITEQGEKETLAKIRQELALLEKGEVNRETILAEIRKFSLCNRQAIIRSAEKTQRMRQAGAWGIVFMTLLFFIAALLFEKKLRKSILEPLEEIDSVLEAERKGDKFRRCSGSEASGDMKKIFRAINDLLDNTGRNR